MGLCQGDQFGRAPDQRDFQTGDAAQPAYLGLATQNPVGQHRRVFAADIDSTEFLELK